MVLTEIEDAIYKTIASKLDRTVLVCPDMAGNFTLVVCGQGIFPIADLIIGPIKDGKWRVFYAEDSTIKPNYDLDSSDPNFFTKLIDTVTAMIKTIK